MITTEPKIQERTKIGEVLFDSGANCCITPFKEDYENSGDFERCRESQVEGLNKGLHIEGKGTVCWTFKTDTGWYRDLWLPAYYVPSTSTRIASTQVVVDEESNQGLFDDRKQQQQQQQQRCCVSRENNQIQQLFYFLNFTVVVIFVSTDHQYHHPQSRYLTAVSTGDHHWRPTPSQANHPHQTDNTNATINYTT